MPSRKRTRDGISRRSFMRLSSATVGLLTFGALNEWVPGKHAAAEPLADHRRLIIVNFRGGNDGLNTLVPTQLVRYYDRRPTISISNAEALALNGVSGYMLHPNLTRIQGLFNDGDAAIINKVGYQNANLSHFVSEDIWSFGVRGSFTGLGVPAFSGWISRFADLYANTPMGVVSVGQGNLKDFQGGQVATPLQMQTLSRFDFDVDNQYSANHALRLDTVAEVLGDFEGTGLSDTVASASLQAYDLAAQVQAASDAYAEYAEGPGGEEDRFGYGDTNFGSRARDVATLIHGGFDTRLFYTGFGGFDTHSGQDARHIDLLTRFDTAIGALSDDLKDQGVWDDTMIVVISEFGRRNYENGSAGTDHGHGNVLFVFGGGVEGGLYGPDLQNADLDTEFLGYEIDFRTVYEQIIQDHLGNDPAPVFPEEKEVSTSPGDFIT